MEAHRKHIGRRSEIQTVLQCKQVWRNCTNVTVHDLDQSTGMMKCLGPCSREPELMATRLLSPMFSLFVSVYSLARKSHLACQPRRQEMSGADQSTV